MKNIFHLLFGILLLPLSGNAQETWSLQKCIEYAQKKSLLIKQGQIGISGSEITLQQSKMSRYPTVNGSMSYGVNSGRFFDPVSNAPATQTSQFNSFGLNAGVALYQGGRIKNSIRQAELDIQAGEMDIEQTRRDIALQVAQAYLQILLSEEQLAAAQGRLQQVQDQLSQTEKLIRAGTLPANNKLDIEAQIAQTEQTVIAAENAVTIGYLNLKQIMALELDMGIRTEKPSIKIVDSDLRAVSVSNIYKRAIKTQPNLKAGELRIQSAEVSEEIAKAGKLPTVTLFGGMSTNYSSLAQVPDGTFETVVGDPFTLLLEMPDGTVLEGDLSFANEIPNFKKQPYFNQVSSNLGQNIGVNVSIPIWNNNNVKFQMQRARLSAESIELQNEQIRQRLMVDIQNAYANALAAKKTYEAAERSVTSLNAAYENTAKRYELGAANSFELRTSQNSLALAESELIRSKYDYLFRLKILDYYEGKDIKL